MSKLVVSVVVLTSIVFGFGLMPKLAHAQVPGITARQVANTASDAFEWGDYERAKKLAAQTDDVPSLLVRAKLADLGGDLAEAARFAKVATTSAVKPEEKRRADAYYGQLLVEQGLWAEGETVLRDALKRDGASYGVRFQLGQLLWMQGKRSEARVILDALSTAFNNGALDQPRDLVDLARGMWLLGRFNDANYALKVAVEKDPKYTDAHIVWGQLLLTKYNIADAHASFVDALKINPSNPAALAGRAFVEMLTSNQSDSVREHLDYALKVSPSNPEALLALGHLGLRDEDCASTRKAADRILKQRPKHLDALILKSTCDYLDDDKAAFIASRAHFNSLSPDNADLLVTVADYGVRAHRYIEAMTLYRDALKLEPEHAGALLGLGVGLSRTGDEDEAQQLLARAFELDPYNIRALNMVELYEKTMPDYEFTLYDGFKLRAHKEQRELVNLFVAPIVTEAIKAFSAKYHVKPWSDVAVEIYPDSPTFAIRSVGMPNISPHGICFGKVVTVRSPSDGNFNWRQVVWHELAHTFHLFVSKSRVPRWFTEGLAEYETNVYDPSWIRHHDLEIAIKLQKEEIPSVLLFNRGFTHARSMGEVLRSYHLASLAIHFIAQTWGFEKVVGMLNGWGDQKETTQVLKDVLGVEVAQFDARFMAWLKQRFMHFEHQALLDFEAFSDMETIERELRLNARNPKALATMAALYMGRNNPPRAEEVLARALEIAPKDVFVNQIAMLIRDAQGRSKDVLVHGDIVLASFQDSYPLRLTMGKAALRADDIKGARVHFEAATQMYPTGQEAWGALMRLGKSTKDDALYQLALKTLYELNPHDPMLPRLMTRQALASKDLKLATTTARRWMDISPFDEEAQRALITTSVATKDWPNAQLGWDGLLLSRSDLLAQTYQEAISTLSKAGKPELAKTYAERARKQDIDEALIKRALGTSG